MLAVKELVVGDLIQLKGGDVIPADSRVRADNCITIMYDKAESQLLKAVMPLACPFNVQLEFVED